MKRFFVVTGPSAGGKTYLTGKLFQKHNSLYERVVTTTSRERRSGGAKDKYYFRSLEEFHELRKNGGFVEWEEVYSETKGLPSRWYGIEKKEIIRVRSLQKNPVAVVDVNGALKFSGKVIDESHSIDRKFLQDFKIVTFFIYSPLHVLEARLRDDIAKGNRDGRDLDQRLAQIELELNHQDVFDFKIDNSENNNFGYQQFTQSLEREIACSI